MGLTLRRSSVDAQQPLGGAVKVGTQTGLVLQRPGEL